MTEHKNPVWPWIVALLIGLPVLYVASFGPACWIGFRSLYGRYAVIVAYKPLLRAPK